MITTVGCALKDSDAILVCFTRQRMKKAWTFSYDLDVVRGREVYNTGFNTEVIAKHWYRLKHGNILFCVLTFLLHTICHMIITKDHKGEMLGAENNLNSINLIALAIQPVFQHKP